MQANNLWLNFSQMLPHEYLRHTSVRSLKDMASLRTAMHGNEPLIVVVMNVMIGI